MTTIWLSLDPRERRVSVLPWPPGEDDFPRGLRGAGWPVRTLDVDAEELARLLAGELPPDEQDRVHRAWWDAADPTGPPWPSL